MVLLLLNACSMMNRGRPKALNTPKKLTNDIETIKPTEYIEEEKGGAKITEVEKLFDFSNKNTSYEYTPYGSKYDSDKELGKKEGIEEPIQNIVIEDKLDNKEEEKKIEIKPKDEYLRVGVLLPLSGNYESVGKELKNAATMAMFNMKLEKMILQFYDSKGTASGAKEATEKANEDGVDVIIGPLFAEEVISSKKVSNVPIISFTTDQEVLSGDTFSIGFLLEQQIKRIVEYAISKGYETFGVIVPDNDTGNFISNKIENYANQFGGEVVSIKKYKNKKEDLMNSVKEISNYDERRKEYKEYKNAAKARLNYLLELKELENSSEYLYAYDSTQYSSTDEEVEFLEKTLEDLEKVSTITDPNYESIFVYGDDINDVIMIGSSLMYYDVNPDRVKFIGTSQLENNKVFNERAFRLAWYPSVSTKYSGEFTKAYKEYYGKTPNKISSLAYDAVALIGTLSKYGEVNKTSILNPNGWTGINGIFRFKRDGSSERNMDVKEILGGATIKTKIISPAALSFM